MSSARHPDQVELLRYADGELPARQARHVRRHLEACWQCRAELEELQNLVGDCVRYHQTVLPSHLPPPPAPWGDIYRSFADIDSALDHVSLSHRVAQFLQFPVRHAKRWVPVAAALAAIWGIVYQLRDTPSVQASALLRKAIAAEDRQPSKPHRRIRIRTRRQSVTRVADLSAVLPLFQAAHYNSDDPFSARSFAAWRDQLPDRTDQVTTLPDAYQIRTATASGELEEATLKLSARDLRPMEEKLQFRNQEWVEIAEVPEDLAPPAALAGAATPPVPAASHPDSLRSPAPAATLGDELAVLVALHGVGADLGDPIEVKRDGGQILVAGVGIDPTRRQQIASALASQSNVIVRFSDPAEAAPATEKKAPAEIAVGADALALQARIQKQTGGRAAFEQISSQLLDMSDLMMARAYALRRLAERFPPATEAQLSSADRQRLRGLHREHTDVLARQVAQMERLLTPLFAPLSGASETPGPPPVEAWQPATEALFNAARRVETNLAVMLGVAPADGAAGNLGAQLLSSLAQLKVRSEECRRILQDQDVKK